MWLLLAMWLVRGGTMSDTRPAPTDLTPALPVAPARTIHDVEADLALAGLELRHHRQGRLRSFGEAVNNDERLRERPALLVLELNALLDEWAQLNAAR